MPTNDDREQRAYRRPLDQAPVNLDDGNVSSSSSSFSFKIFFAVTLVILVGFFWCIMSPQQSKYPRFASYGFFQIPSQKS